MKFFRYIFIGLFTIWGSGCGQEECLENADCPEQWQCVSSDVGMRCLDPETAAEEEFQNGEFVDTLKSDLKDFLASHSESESALSFADESDLPRPENVNISDYIGIKSGDKGFEAYELQEFLNAAGADIASDGAWGANSRRALMDFQSEQGLSVTGETTEETIEAVLEQAWMADTEVEQSVYEQWLGIKNTSVGNAVKTLQSRLKELGFPVARISGKLSNNYGLKALKGFQIRAGIVADGVVGATTIKKLISGRALNDLIEMPSERLSTSISYAQFRKIPYLAVDEETSRQILPYVNLILKNAGAKTSVEKAMIISQIAHETGYFDIMTERRSNYRSSRSTYKGRGFIQLTGQWNYKTAGKELSLPILKRPTMVKELRYGAVTTSWFWSYKNMKRFVQSENIRGCINKINPGGPISKRAAYYRKVKRALF